MTIPVNIQRSISVILLKNRDKFYVHLGNTKLHMDLYLPESVNNNYNSLIEEISIITASIRNKVNKHNN